MPGNRRGICSKMVLYSNLLQNRLSARITNSLIKGLNMVSKQQLQKRFEAIKVSNFAESLRLEGLKPTKDKASLNPKILARLKQLQELHD